MMSSLSPMQFHEKRMIPVILKKT